MTAYEVIVLFGFTCLFAFMVLLNEMVNAKNYLTVKVRKTNGYNRIIILGGLTVEDWENMGLNEQYIILSGYCENIEDFKLIF